MPTLVETNPSVVAELPTLADTANQYRCYELSVQCVETEVDFIDRNFSRQRGRSVHLLRVAVCRE